MQVTVQLTMTIEQQSGPSPEKKTGIFQGYIPAITEEQARMLFERKYGRPPEMVVRTGGSINAGPLTEEEAKR